MSTFHLLTQRAAATLARRSARSARSARPTTFRRRRSAQQQCTRVSSAMAAASRTAPAHHQLRQTVAFDVPSLLNPSVLDVDVATTATTTPSRPASVATQEQLPVFQRQCSVLDVVSDLRTLKAVARVKLFGLPSQVNGPLPVSYHASEVESDAAAADASANMDDVEFCSQSLDDVSRSFAAVIRQLPSSLAMPTCAFYLVLRALDTVEDEMDFGKFGAASTQALAGTPAASATVASDPLLFKTHCLLGFHGLLDGQEHNDAAWNTLRALNACDVGAGDDQVLLKSFDRVVAVLREHCTPAQREIIADITQQMAAGMAKYVQRDLGVDGTDSSADYDQYCHIVAGLVGEGLSRLWATAEDSGLPAQSLTAVNAATGLGSLSSDMGLFLQKANIIRDYSEDQVDGRAFWPRDVWGQFSPNNRLGVFRADSAVGAGAGLACLNSMVNDALALAPRCFEYLQHLAPGDARILRFCAIPQVMALCTLVECYGNTNVFRGIVKAPRTQSARICCEVGDMNGVLTWYDDVCGELEAKAAVWEESESFDVFRDAAVVAETRARIAEVRAAVRQFEATDDLHGEECDDDDDHIPENWPCGPHSAMLNY